MATRPFLGSQPVPFRQAFPNIGKFSIRIEQDIFGFHTQGAWQRVQNYTPDQPPPEIVACINPRCKQGGLDLRAFIYTADGRTGPLELEETFHCHGREGSLKGRRIGDPCDNSFKATMKFEARPVRS